MDQIISTGGHHDQSKHVLIKRLDLRFDDAFMVQRSGTGHGDVGRRQVGQDRRQMLALHARPFILWILLQAFKVRMRTGFRAETSRDTVSHPEHVHTSLRPNGLERFDRDLQTGWSLTDGASKFEFQVRWDTDENDDRDDKQESSAEVRWSTRGGQLGVHILASKKDDQIAVQDENGRRNSFAPLSF
ncbi:hypothetical protein RISK_001654 [Rhodopirellula islandica]|uniref:Uncharacterized protein n=1 Tax=Rhodopirellula islandica TaxID=595434 RepID=A0A0J1BJ33_RHOIS|nr:hypothetical protein RISK_001654 [Rhodopirellula islandica]